MQKRLGDHARLYFEASRQMGAALHQETVEVTSRFREALDRQARELAKIPWPVRDDVIVNIPPPPHLAHITGDTGV